MVLFAWLPPIERRYYTIFILCVINLLNYMDRYAVASVLLDIEGYFGLQNQQAGLIQTVFVTCYMTFAPLAGYLGDRYDRKLIILAGVSVWCLTTLASSFVGPRSFWLFLLLRSLVGVGEASYSTVAPTIFADLFADEEEGGEGLATGNNNNNKRLACLSAFYFAIPVGSGMGYILASSLAHATNFWAWGLRITPVIGAVLLVIFYYYVHDIPKRVWTVRHESPTSSPYKGSALKSYDRRLADDETRPLVTRSESGPGDDDSFVSYVSHHPNIRARVTAFAYLIYSSLIKIPPGLAAWFADVRALLRIPTFASVTLAITWVSFVVGALALWAPTFMQLSANASGPTVPVTQEIIGFRFGLVTCGAGALGLIGGGEIARRARLRPRIGERADPLVCGYALLIGSPLLYAAIYLAKFAAHTGPAGSLVRASSWFAIFLAETAFCSCWALVVDTTLSVVPASRRSTSQATQMLISHALGDASSAYVVGAISQAILASWYPGTWYDPNAGRPSGLLPSFADRFRALQYALYVTPFVGVAGGYFFLRASYTIKVDIKGARASEIDIQTFQSSPVTG